MNSLTLAAIATALAACSATGQAPPVATTPAAELSARGVDAKAVQDSVMAVLTRGLKDTAFPGAFAIVGTRSGVVARGTVGMLDRAPGSPVPDENTIWDMASLTKVIALTSSVMQLVAAGKIDLAAPVQQYLPEWKGQWKDQVKVRDLLTHTAGLPAWRPLYKETADPAAALALVFSTPLEAAPNTRMVYSDLGAILMGQIVQRVSREKFADYTAKHLFEPLGMAHTRFLPPKSWLPQIAPTEVDPWRQRHLRGEVHDENAYRLGGVSSHAGLFSTGADLSRFARMMLNNGTLDGKTILDSATIRLFTTTQDAALSPRGIGWETASGQNSGGRKMSKRAFGHTGFTGTSIWIDPEKDVFVVLLTNRVNPTRENRAIGSVRTALADAVMGAFGVR